MSQLPSRDDDACTTRYAISIDVHSFMPGCSVVIFAVYVEHFSVQINIGIGTRGCGTVKPFMRVQARASASPSAAARARRRRELALLNRTTPPLRLRHRQPRARQPPPRLQVESGSCCAPIASRPSLSCVSPSEIPADVEHKAFLCARVSQCGRNSACEV